MVRSGHPGWVLVMVSEEMIWNHNIPIFLYIISLIFSHICVLHLHYTNMVWKQVHAISCSQVPQMDESNALCCLNVNFCGSSFSTAERVYHTGIPFSMWISSSQVLLIISCNFCNEELMDELHLYAFFKVFLEGKIFMAFLDRKIPFFEF